MIEREGNLWASKANAVCILTNGMTDGLHRAVMGAGVAKEAADYYSWLPILLGDKLIASGNHAYRFTTDHYTVFPDWHPILYTFPTKNDWRDRSTIPLIRQSFVELMELAVQDANLSAFRIALPRPGCGLGGLSWHYEVKPLLQEMVAPYESSHISVEIWSK